jgi:hypothetical protein
LLLCPFAVVLERPVLVDPAASDLKCPPAQRTFFTVQPVTQWNVETCSAPGNASSSS